MLMCFQADVLLEILTVRVSGYRSNVQVTLDFLHLGGGWFHVLVWIMDPAEYCTWGFCNITVNSGMCIGPVKGLSARR